MNADDVRDQSDLIERQRVEILRLENEQKVADIRIKQLCEELRKILEQ